MHVCILDATGKVLVHQNIPTRPKDFLRLIRPYRDGLVVGCECMFTWYWLADLCAERNRFRPRPCPLHEGHSWRQGQERQDRFAQDRLCCRGGIPLAYAYPKAMRATRDLLRRRKHLRANEPNSSPTSRIRPASTTCRTVGMYCQTEHAGGPLQEFPDPVYG